MLAVKGFYDGTNIKLVERINISYSQPVIIVFPDVSDIMENTIIQKNIYTLAESGGSFDYLNDPAENIYSESDLKTRYANE